MSLNEEESNRGAGHACLCFYHLLLFLTSIGHNNYGLHVNEIDG